MRIGSVCLAYNEARFISAHLNHLPTWIEERVVLVSTQPWQGSHEGSDLTADIARQQGAIVIEHYWESEEDQRNAGQDYLYDMDWIIVLDPDEFLTKDQWTKLREFLNHATVDAYVTGSQLTYWKSGYVIDPPEEYKQIIAVRPSVRFIDKRVVDTHWDYAPTVLHHFSWARTDAECLSKISHYAHAHELDPNWYKDVWLSDRLHDLHPLSPSSLKQAIPVTLPKELEGLWP